LFYFPETLLQLFYQPVRLKTERDEMKALLITATFVGAYWAVESMPTFLAIPVGLIALAVMLFGAIALGVKWVRNV
jgi:hypothetical protein